MENNYSSISIKTYIFISTLKEWYLWKI